MRSAQLENVIQLFKAQREAGNVQAASVAEMRQGYELLGQAVPPVEGVDVVAVDVDGMGAERIGPADATAERTILYLHGGGYCIGSLNTHRHMAAHLSKAAQVPVLVIDYRLAPEHPFPAAVEDATKAYRWLLDKGFDPGSIAVSGDSAGGGLAVSMQVAARDEGLPMPASSSVHSPYADIETLGDVSEDSLDVDWLRPETLERFADWYIGDGDRTAPLASPVYADLSGLPPMLVQAGAVEILADTARRLAARAKDCGVDVTLEIEDELPHAWHHFAGVIPEADPSIARVARFFDEHWR